MTFVHVTTQEGSEFEKGSQNLKKYYGNWAEFSQISLVNKTSDVMFKKSQHFKF
jgi:hypothetical protein